MILPDFRPALSVNLFVSPPQLRLFANHASGIASVLLRSPLKKVVRFGLLANLGLWDARPFNRFAFLRQLKPFPTFVSVVAVTFRD
jgi:hypothetical protein